MTNSAQLCGQCHGNLRFPNTDHLSYNILTGTGGIGITNQVAMGEASCVDCHMFTSDADGSNSRMFHGHSWAVRVQEPGGGSTSSCTKCHAMMDAAAAKATIDAWRSEFQALDATAQANVNRAAAALEGTSDTNLLATLQQAQHNLTYAESDESGGVHNHKYLMALLGDANAKAQGLLPVVSLERQGPNFAISWRGSGTLQRANDIAGPWHSPWTAVLRGVLTHAHPLD